MRVDYTTYGPELPDQNQSKTGRAGQANAPQTGAAQTGASQIGLPEGQGSSAAAADVTNLSFDQARVQSLQAKALAEPEIREAKVQTLQQSISQGEYTIPAGQIAAALVSEWSASQG